MGKIRSYLESVTDPLYKHRSEELFYSDAFICKIKNTYAIGEMLHRGFSPTPGPDSSKGSGYVRGYDSLFSTCNTPGNYTSVWAALPSFLSLPLSLYGACRNKYNSLAPETKDPVKTIAGFFGVTMSAGLNKHECESTDALIELMLNAGHYTGTISLTILPQFVHVGDYIGVMTLVKHKASHYTI